MRSHGWMTNVGSSPRMRGAHLGGCCVNDISGIIPAYAGSTDALDRRAHAHGDHPRVCGEHSAEVTRTCWVRGSSPRMRGARVPKVWLRLGNRIIPAYAGSTRTCGARGTSSRDHPRVCGEHAPLPDVSNPLTGSSPRMRGARPVLEARLRLRGIIPAYAGSTPAF